MKTSKRRFRRGEQGFALLVIIFIGTLMLLAAAAVAPNILTENRREKEKEMIWRGRQYTRGIKLYYRKTGKFPTSMDDLIKPKLGQVRFMRQAFKDPMNKEDGTWRLIYVGPSGQLVGSLKPPQTLQMPGAPGPQMGTPAANMSSVPGTTPGMNSGFGSTNTSSSGFGATAAASGDSPVDINDPKNVPTGETPTIMGGNIIGVGSKINERSVMVYEKAQNYRLFEFIWDPSKDTVGVGSTPPQGASPAGTTPGMQVPVNPSQNPMGPQNPQTPQSPQTPPNPPPQP